jgi:hypothetical protein
MPINIINVNTVDRPLAAKLLQVASALQEARLGCQQLKAIMDSSTDASDWTQLEWRFGLAEGKGETIYNLLSAINAQLQSADCASLVTQLGVVR